MVTAITGGAPSGDAATLAGLATAEAQLIWLCERALDAQVAFNTTDPAPATPINRVAAQLTANGVAAQMTCNLADDAIIGPVWNGCLTIGAGELPVPAEGTPSGDLAELLGLTTLTAQIVYVAAQIQAAENAYVTANPEETINAITLNLNYDSKLVGMSAILPLQGADLASLVGLPY